MSYWIKHFIDSKKEIGKDTDVAEGKASWSRGRLKGITAAILSYAGTIVMASGLDIWQKDKYGGIIGTRPTRISRSLGVKIGPRDVGMKLYVHDLGNTVHHLVFGKEAMDRTYLAIGQNHVGQWAVITIKKNGNPEITIEDRYRV